MTGQELEAKVRLYFEVAKANGSLLSLSELLALVPEPLSEDQLVKAIQSSPELDANYALESGFIVERRSLDRGAAATEKKGRSRAESNLAYSERVLPLLDHPSALLLGISGSTSYKSASRSQDLDLFCVTRSGMLWVFLTRALLISRALRALVSGAPSVCLSCTMDARAAEESFAYANDPLFARDALSVIVVKGERFYECLLASSRWISEFYPKLYWEKLRLGQASQQVPEASASAKVFNKLLYFTVGNYVRLKSWHLNRDLARQGRGDSAFNLLIGDDKCVYESARYIRMKRMYRTLKEG